MEFSLKHGKRLGSFAAIICLIAMLLTMGFLKFSHVLPNPDVTVATQADGIGTIGWHFDLVDQVGQSVALGIKIRRINLIYVAGENDFGPHTGPGDNRFYLVGGEILRFVNDENHFGQTPTTYIC